MTQQQQDQFAKALARAKANGLQVAGRGTWKHSGERFIAITSASEPGRVHLVTVCAGVLLECDCTAAQHGKYCQHRAMAHEELKRERDRSRVLAEAVEVAHRAELAARRDTSAMVRPAFSIWAS